MRQTTWLWPDRTIGKKESRRLREEHNRLANEHAEAIDAIAEIFKHCTLINSTWGDGCNREQSDAAIARARAIIAAAEGGAA